MGRRRAVVLLLVHVAIFAHILQWLLQGRTLSPVEPSEAMYTIATGVVNAGAILLILSLLSTMILGRWFCGWTCHLVALQDLCAWLLKKVGIRPRPLRSRLLVWVPLLAGIHLFFFPLFARWWQGTPAPDFSNGLMRDDFWETFPGPWVAVGTVAVCGFVIVYLLGAKGFCTYACPYGGLFGVVDRVAPGRIRVTDACKGCGHCSAVCTSNVMVAKEVHEFGMVVDPGCMKCMDCVSVCPEDALYFGFGKPALKAAPRVKHRKPRPAQFRVGEEVALVLSFSLSMLILRGVPPLFSEKASGILYGEMPQLFALGVSAIVAFTSVLLWRTLTGTDVTFQKWTLKAGGRVTRPGRVWLTFAVLLHLWVLHSGVVQLLMLNSRGHWSDTAPLSADVWTQSANLASLPEDMRETIDAGERILKRADSIGLFPDHRIHRDLTWFAMCRGDLDAAAEHIDVAVRYAPRLPNLRYFRAYVSALRERFEDTWDFLEDTRLKSSEHGPYTAPAQGLLSELAQRGMFGTIKGLLAAAPEDIAALPENMMLDAEASMAMGSADECFDTVTRVLADPRSIQRVSNLGARVVNLAQLDPKRALAMIEAARATQPGAYHLHVLGVEAAALARDIKQAEQVARDAVKRWGDRKPQGFPRGHPYMLLADVLQERGEPQEAARMRARARAVNPQRGW